MDAKAPDETIMANDVARLVCPITLLVSQDVRIALIGTIPQSAMITARYLTGER